MPKILTFADRQKEFDAKFKSTGVTLKTYEGTLKPCVVHCDIHGDQTVSTYNNAFKSKKGCPGVVWPTKAIMLANSLMTSTSSFFTKFMVINTLTI